MQYWFNLVYNNFEIMSNIVKFHLIKNIFLIELVGIAQCAVPTITETE